MDTDKDNGDKDVSEDFIQYFDALEKKSELTFRFFDEKEHFFVVGNDALFVADNVMKSRSKIWYRGASRIPVLKIPSHKINETFRHLLLRLLYRIEIHEKKGKCWQLREKASPGNLGEELENRVYDGNELNDGRGLLAVKFTGNDDIHVSIAFVDVVDRTLSVMEFDDNVYLTNFEALLVQLGPKECIASTELSNRVFYERFERIVQLNCMLNLVKSKDFRVSDVKHELKSIRRLLLDKPSIASDSIETIGKQKEVVSVLSAAINYSCLYNDDTNFGQYVLKHVDSRSIMRMDSSAIGSLQLFPLSTAISEQKKSQNMKNSLFELLNHCKTVAGRRTLAQWIRQPLTDVKMIEERLNLVEYFLDNTCVRQHLRSQILRRVPDLIRLSKKFHRKKASLIDCVKVYHSATDLSEIHEWLQSKDNHTVKDTILDPLLNIRDQLKEFTDLVVERISFGEAAGSDPFINPGADKSLYEKSVILEKLKNEANNILQKVAHEFNLDQEKTLKLECNMTTGYFLRTTKAQEKALRRKSIILVENAKKDAIRFTNTDLQKLSDEYLRVRKAYEEEQKEAVNMILDIAKTFSDKMRHLGALLSYLDVLLALTTAAANAEIRYVRPTVLPKENGKIILKGVRHPCLEISEKIYISNDVEFDHKKFFLVTGPNMGGKSTYMRSVGLCVLMAQIGSFVPASSATISVVDGIYTRVGASDKTFKGYSTFMVEMVETTSIIRSATKHSLVIIDELGRGTSTHEGFGLAWAISKYIAETINAYCLFATHFHELTELSEEVESVGNLHVSAVISAGKLTLLYKVKSGSCDQSYGIHVADLVNFPPHMIEMAKEKVRELESGDDEKAEHEKLIEKLMEKFGDKDTDTMSDDEIMRIASTL